MLDPLHAGLVTSLNRPGGNLTGITLDAGIEVWRKRLQILKDGIPSIAKHSVCCSTRTTGSGSGLGAEAQVRRTEPIVGAVNNQLESGQLYLLVNLWTALILFAAASAFLSWKQGT
jgi:hypothetical protein